LIFYGSIFQSFSKNLFYSEHCRFNKRTATATNLPFVDSVTTVLSVFGQFLLIKRYIEHWIIWIVVDVVSVVMWVYALNTEGESVATLLMWIVFTMNGFIMFFKWRCDMKRQKISDES
jgi:nicotinamide mononucleotide transporter